MLYDNKKDKNKDSAKNIHINLLESSVFTFILHPNWRKNMSNILWEDSARSHFKGQYAIWRLTILLQITFKKIQYTTILLYFLTVLNKRSEKTQILH